MEMKYEKSVDALYIKLKRGKVLKTKEQGGYVVDYNKKGEVLGLEILNYPKKTSNFKSTTTGKLAKQAVA